MTKTLEQNQWYKGKSPVVREYLQTAKQIEDAVAMRGHLYRPGFLGYGITEVESGLKYKLSEINYQIISDAVERELKQTGINYDLAIKNAAIAWQLDKTQTLSDLEELFARNKRDREADKAGLERAEMYINITYKQLIMAAKLAIDREMETIKRAIIETENDLFPYELTLLEAQRATANKKLEVIEIINGMLEVQWDIIEQERDNANAKSGLIREKERLNTARISLIGAREPIILAIADLIFAKGELVDKRETLALAKDLISDQERRNVNYMDVYLSTLDSLYEAMEPLIEAKGLALEPMQDRTDAIIDRTTEITDNWIVVKGRIATLKEDIAEEMKTRADNKGFIIDEQILLNDLKETLREEERDFEIANMKAKNALLTQKTTNLPLMLTEKERTFVNKLTREGMLIDKEIEVNDYEVEALFVGTSGSTGEKGANLVEFNAEKAYKNSEANEYYKKELEIATATANAKVTSQLIHLMA